MGGVSGWPTWKRPLPPPKKCWKAGDAAADAAQTFEAILGEEPRKTWRRLWRAGALPTLPWARLDQAEAVLNGTPAEFSDSARSLKRPTPQLELARQAENAGPVAELRAAVEADPAMTIRRGFDLAQALHAARPGAEGAVNELLELFRRDREWNDGAAKAQLFTIFDSLQANDPVVLNGRRKLSSLIFA